MTAASCAQQKRGASFKNAEVKIILDFIEEVLPIGGTEWDRILEMHEERFPDHNRTLTSIKRKYQDLHRKRVPTGDPKCPPLVKRAKHIHYAIQQRSEAEAEINANDIGFELGEEKEAHEEDLTSNPVRVIMASSMPDLQTFQKGALGG